MTATAERERTLKYVRQCLEGHVCIDPEPLNRVLAEVDEHLCCFVACIEEQARQKPMWRKAATEKIGT